VAEKHNQKMASSPGGKVSLAMGTSGATTRKKGGVKKSNKLFQKKDMTAGRWIAPAS